jgi:hypothetical protein
MAAPFNPSFAAPAGAAVGADLDNAPQAHLEHTAEGDPEAEVLVIGSGPAGAGRRAGAGLAGRYRVITRYRWTANTPRAQRTMEIFRALGIEDDVLAHGIEHALMGDSVFCTSLACDERSAGYEPLAPTRRAQLVSLPPPVWGCTRRLGLGQYHHVRCDPDVAID